MLAQAAKQAGYTPFVIDLYADRDTRLYVQKCYPIASLALTHVVPALEAFFARHPLMDMIYGSGFEDYPESLDYLADRLVIWGNQPDVFMKIQDKKNFFPVLTDLGIPYPEISFTEPRNIADAWLIKPLQGHGGIGIRHYQQADDKPTSVYWQRYIEGTSHSVLFLADGENIQIVGFNRQWPVTSGQNDFIFSGIINDGNVPDEHKARVTEWLRKIVNAFALKGLNSLDFICTMDSCYVLEINARPPASMQLYNSDLFARHIDACQGRLTGNPPIQCPYKAYQIIYAERDIQIPESFEWPSGCMDLPNEGALIYTGQPICSIIASQKQSRQVLQQLVIKRQIIINQLKGI